VGGRIFDSGTSNGSGAGRARSVCVRVAPARPTAPDTGYAAFDESDATTAAAIASLRPLTPSLR
jgi:hypothetical protein